MDVDKIETSIVMAHYSEDEERTALSKRCILAIQPYRDETTEFILVCNGHYEQELRDYCDQYSERDADASPGKSFNIGARMAHGNILAFLCDDVLVQGNWLEECKEIVLKYPKYLATPSFPLNRKWHELPKIDGYCTNSRVGSDCVVMKRDQYDDIGPFDEVNPMYDGSNYLDRRIKKEYAGMMTKTRLAINLGTGVHSYAKQQQQMGYTYRGK
jgi:hypothetical protein